MRALFVAVALLTFVPFGAQAEKPDLTAGQDAPLDHPGFGALKWGAPIKAVYQVYPELKKRYRPAQVVKALRAGKVVVLSLPVLFKDEPFTARLHVEPDGLHRVDLTREIAFAPDAPKPEQVMAPIVGNLPKPDAQPKRQVWKGGKTVLVATTESLATSTRVELAFINAERYRPEEAGGSLSID